MRILIRLIVDRRFVLQNLTGNLTTPLAVYDIYCDLQLFIYMMYSFGKFTCLDRFSFNKAVNYKGLSQLVADCPQRCLALLKPLQMAFCLFNHAD